MTKMHISNPSLHPPVVMMQSDRDSLASQLSPISAELAARVTTVSRTAVAAASLNIPLTTVSLNGNFDAYIHITYRDAPATLSVPLMVDSGNFSLIVPEYEKIAALPNFGTDYAILADNVTEPWGCPAKILKGPIRIPTQDGSIYEIPGCVFYACTGTSPSTKQRTANFGAGCISPWGREGNVTIQSPLSFDPAYPFAEFNYVSASRIFSATSQVNLAQGSSLTLYRTTPTGYQMFNIIKNLMWMSLIPRSLSIGAVKTAWPGLLTLPPIAMVDTGGGPVFLSDPNADIYTANWPNIVPSPSWTSPGSLPCESTKQDITIDVGDTGSSFTYRIDTSTLPPPVQGLTLVMCRSCEYMRQNQGMNLGGISALFNYILIDFSSGKVGFKAKAAALV
ncbi:hypothetical protein [Bradyrhizobium sp. Ash2021]|uniref:hypothetical protein n=1 Tax=Bradyrhizobium sp. Ash2021 TaxID=2954771 RepID=UPI0028169914|nr:hypothetical protein [Bradyrhizobium sp. Ash2021]WMT77673.1 hypothetical protein NL528_15510 [Bradyrhizobium sp. Ash2021]